MYSRYTFLTNFNILKDCAAFVLGMGAFNYKGHTIFSKCCDFSKNYTHLPRNFYVQKLDILGDFALELGIKARTSLYYVF